MIFPKDAFYSLKPLDIQENTAYLHGFYNKMVDPLAILLLLTWVLSFYSTRIYQNIAEKFMRSDPTAYMLVILALITLTVGCRLIHSLYWASRDYSRMEYGMPDIIAFGAILFFCSGRIFIWFGSQPIAILITYAALSLVGTINFINIGRTRIPSDPRHYDLPIERKIQRFNSVAFSVLFVEFVTTSLLLIYAGEINSFFYCLPLLPALPLVILNMVHAHQLSAWPKMLINNKYLAIDKIEDRLSVALGIEKESLEKQRYLNQILEEYKIGFKLLNLRRAQSRDIAFISNLYETNFGYVLENIFPGSHIDRRMLLTHMLNSGYGLGVLGYLRFYIIEVDGKSCGFIMPEFHSELSVYEWIGSISLAWTLLKVIRLREVVQVRRQAKKLRESQPKPGSRDMNISYIAIVDDKKNQGNGSRVVRLLKQAYLESSVNRYYARTLSAYVRESNISAVRLFEKAGFSRHNLDYAENAADPLCNVYGALIKFTISKDIE